MAPASNRVGLKMKKLRTQREAGKEKGHGKTKYTLVHAAFLRANLQPDIPLQHLL